MSRRPRSGPTILLPILTLAISGLLGPVAAQDPPSEWDITVPRGETREIAFTTTEGTWMAVDPSPDGRWLVFDLLGHVYRMPASGGPAQALTQDSGLALNIHPTYSPDGSRIAFISDRSGQNNLWIMDADGSNPRPVFESSAVRAMEPVWTPDGEYVVVRQIDMDGGALFDYGLYMYHRDGGRGIELVPYSTEAPGWPSVSPDGRFVYYHQFVGDPLPYGGQDSSKGDFQLRRLELATGRVTSVTAGTSQQQGRGTSGGAFAPSVSPDGRSLVFARRIPDALLEYRGHVFGPRTGLWVRDLESGSERLVMDPVEWDLTQEITRATPILPRYRWADGGQIYLSQGGRIRRLDVATGDVETIPFEAQVQRTISEMAYGTRSIPDGSFDARFLRWPTASPDGSLIAFEGVGRIHLQPAAGGEAQRLTPDDFTAMEYAPAWSPDGRWVAFTTFDWAEGGQVWRVPVEGGAPEQISQAPGEYLNPRWSPDGTEILVARGSGATFRGRSPSDNAWYDLVRLPVAGGEAVSVARVDGAAAPVGAYTDGGRIYFVSRDTVVSVDPSGADRRGHVRLPSSWEAVPSPDGARVAFVTVGDVFVAPVPPGRSSGGVPSLERSNGILPVERLTTEGGLFPRWRSSSVLELGSGPRYVTYDVIDDSATSTTLTLRVPRSVASGTVALTGARIVTLDAQGVLENGDVVVRDGRILCVGDCDTSVADEVVDASGKTIIPGWVDVHGHHNGQSMQLVPSRGFEYAIYLAYGVTTTRDPAAFSLNVWSAKELVAAGRTIGPRIFGTGETLTPGDSPFKADVGSREEAEHQVARLEAWGAESIKQYLQPRRAQAQWLVDAARSRGLVATAEGGNFDLSHNIGLVMDGHAGFEHALVQFPIYADVSRFLGQAGFHYSPTAVVGGSAPWSEEYFFQESDTWRDAKLREWLPWRQLIPHARRRTMRPVTDYGFAIVAEGMADVIEAGGYGAIGSHGQQHGLASHWEVWMYAEALGPLAALEVASLHGAHFLGVQEELGSLTVGKYADLMVLDANPLEDIRNTLSIDRVMKDGVLYDGSTLDEVWPEAREFGPRYWVDEDALKSDTLSVGRWNN